MNLRLILLPFLASVFFLSTCSSPTSTEAELSPTAEVKAEKTEMPKEESSPSPSGADVIAVEMSRDQDILNFSVTITSPDEGCDRYADWWEVISADGELIYRRVLLHSHVNEQPFARSGGPVKIEPDSVVWVRAHMHPDGYGGMAMQGSLAKGFAQTELNSDFASHLAETSPLPQGCDF
jgi:hypothetical protein